VILRHNITLSILVILFLANNQSYADSWEYSEFTDSISDIVYGRVYPNGIKTSPYGALLVPNFDCGENGLRLTLSHDAIVGGSASVQIRVDKNEPYGPESWAQGINRKISFAPSFWAALLLDQILEGSSLIVRITDPYDGDRIETSLSLNGLGQTLDSLSCYPDNIYGNSSIETSDAPQKSIDLINRDQSRSLKPWEYKPMVDVEPKYPRRALRQEIEGYVTLVFSIDDQGRVIKDSIMVLDSDPHSRDLEKASINAAKNLSYDPKVIQSERGVIEGVQHTFKFELPQER